MRVTSSVVALSLLAVAAALPIPSASYPPFHGYTAADGFNLTALDEYVATPDSNYKWEKLDHEIHGLGWTGTILNVTSQRWLSDADTTCSLWWHLVVVVKPIDLKDHNRAVVYITGNGMGMGLPSASDEDVALAAALAIGAGTLGAVIFQIPNEPCYFSNDPLGPTKRRSEDGVIAMTWWHFLRNPEQPEWLLRLPMTKGVVRVMDALTEYSSGAMGLDLKQFAVAGASKRGWTTWTVAAVDKRVFAAIPIVMSALNFVDNVHHFWRNLGGWTFAFNDYYEMNFTREIDNPNLQKLAAIVDPFSYRDRYQMPFMLVSTTGDEFFQPDDTHYFWDKMPAATRHFLIAHNAEHSCATAIPEIIPAIGAFVNAALAGRRLPQMNWTIADDGTIHLQTEVKPTKVVVHYADTLSTERRDFRLATGQDPCPYIPVKGLCIQPVLWHKSAANVLSPTEFTANMGQPEKGWRGFFMEVHFDEQVLFPVTLTTQVSILPNTFPFPDCHGEECYGTLV